MRALTGPAQPDKPADPIIVHPDVRRMLLTARAFAQGNRCLAIWTSKVVDRMMRSEDENERKHMDLLLGFITPICKAFFTETGFEAANHGLQCFGGHGFIREWGMEQNVRDCRISMLYEGTTGIQSLDLLGRKVLMSNGESLKAFTKEVYTFAKANEDHPVVGRFCKELLSLLKEWGNLTMGVGVKAMKNPNEVGAAAVDYLMYSGYICVAWCWAMMAKTAADKLDAGGTEKDFYQGKIATADFYFKRILPRTAAHKAMIEAGAGSLMDIEDAQFA
jgi:hypothetical protein